MMNTAKMTLLCLFAYSTLQAQQHESNKNYLISRQLGLGIGVQGRHLVDEQKSALVYVSKEYQAELFYKKEKNRSLFSVNLDLSRGTYGAKHFTDRKWYSEDYSDDGSIDRDSLPISSGIVTGRFQIAYARKLTTKGKINWYAGTSLRDLFVYPENNIGLLNSLSVNANLYAAYNFNEKHLLNAQMVLPLAAINSRLPWHNTASDPVKSEINTFFNKGSRLVTLNNFQSAQISLNYTCRFSNRFSLGAEYLFTWLRIPYYQPMKSYVNRIQLFTAYNF